MRRFLRENSAAACSGFAAGPTSNSSVTDNVDYMNFNADEQMESLLKKVKTSKILNKIKNSKEKRK